jgi:hypothetical protein
VAPITNIIMFVTAALVWVFQFSQEGLVADGGQVIGYSWVDTHPQLPSTFLYWGINLAIVRVLINISTVVAYRS